MFDEAPDGLGPASDVGDIVANRFGPKISGECAFTRGSRRLKMEHGCSLRQGIPMDDLDVVG